MPALTLESHCVAFLDDHRHSPGLLFPQVPAGKANSSCGSPVQPWMPAACKAATEGARPWNAGLRKRLHRLSIRCGTPNATHLLEQGMDACALNPVPCSGTAIATTAP